MRSATLTRCYVLSHFPDGLHSKYSISLPYRPLGDILLLLNTLTHFE
jgi:hypothetical protein